MSAHRCAGSGCTHADAHTHKTQDAGKMVVVKLMVAVVWWYTTAGPLHPAAVDGRMMERELDSQQQPCWH